MDHSTSGWGVLQQKISDCLETCETGQSPYSLVGEQVFLAGAPETFQPPEIVKDATLKRSLMLKILNLPL
jgi:hypothetical protein